MVEGEFVAGEEPIEEAEGGAAVVEAVMTPDLTSEAVLAAVGGKDTILPVLNAVVVDETGIIIDVVDISSLAFDVPPPPLPPPPPPPAKPLKADADFLTPGNGVSSTGEVRTPPLRNPAPLASTEVVNDAVEVMGDTGGEA